MYEPSERAGVFGWYLLGPLLGKFLVSRTWRVIDSYYFRADFRASIWRGDCQSTGMEMDILGEWNKDEVPEYNQMQADRLLRRFSPSYVD
jgi:hypothetical protein